MARFFEKNFSVIMLVATVVLIGVGWWFGLWDDACVRRPENGVC